MHDGQGHTLAGQILNCSMCGLVCYRADEGAETLNVCPRCSTVISRRKTNSLERSLAFLLAALVLYIPANYLPIMTVTELGRSQSDTIISGVIFLFESDQWVLALLIFFASVVVPILKCMTLGFLLFTVYFKSRWRPKDRTRLYRLTEKIGRWSMVDIYVVTMLVALVQLGAVARIEAELGAVFFGAVVVLTMLSANAFDPRLIWDRALADGKK